ncbi:MAG: hypothetical protein H0U53_02095 [Actinobacteria bacterium]|nr:hypothetical protein [Actinomycetota bacterium]
MTRNNTKGIYASPPVARECGCDRPVTYRDDDEDLRCMCGRPVVNDAELARLSEKELKRSAFETFMVVFEGES